MYIWTDARIIRFGAVLEQWGHCHPIVNIIMQVDSKEKNIWTESEIAALVFVIESFEVYLLGNPFTITYMLNKNTVGIKNLKPSQKYQSKLTVVSREAKKKQQARAL